MNSPANTDKTDANPDTGRRPSRWRRLLVAGNVLLVVFAAGYVVADRPWSDEDRIDDAALLGDDEGPPREFLYLDNARVRTYLSQLTDGLANQSELSRSITDERAAEISAAPAKLGRHIATVRGYEQTVTPTASSRLFDLREHLKERKLLRELPGLARPRSRPCGERPRADAFLAQWRDVREGDFVRVRAHLQLPPYARLYNTLRQAPPNSALGRAGRRLLEAIGPDPRFMFAICVPTGRHRQLRIVFPAQYGVFATEPSLFHGQLSFLGKVLFRLDARGDRHYRDMQTYQRFRPSLDHAPERLLRRLGIRGRDALRRDLLSYYTIRAPAAVVMPIAIYK